MSSRARFLLVTFRFTGPPKVKELEPIFNNALDWARYADNCWIIWTPGSAEYWAGQLKPHIGPNDSLLVFRIDMSDSYGWAPKWVWDWFSKKR